MIRMTGRLSANRRFALTWALLILFSCLALGVLLMNIGVSRLEAAYDSQSKSMLGLVARDFDRQYGVMNDVTLEISITSQFQPSFRERGRYFDIEIIDGLSKYEHISPIADDMFLLYRDDELVFMNEATNRFDVFAETRLKTYDHEALYARLNGIQEKAFIRLEGGTLIVFPVPERGVSKALSNSCLGFLCPDKTIVERVQAVTGGMDGMLTLSFPGAEISLALGDASGADRVYQASALDGLLKLEYSSNSSWWADRINYIYTGMALMGGLTALFMIAARVVAYYNYRPIKRICESLDFPNEIDDFAKIDAAICEMKASCREAQGRFEAQREQLRRKEMLLYLLNGGDAAGEFKIEEGGACIIVAGLNAPPPMGDEAISDLIKNLTQETIAFCAAALPQESMLVIWAGMSGGAKSSDAAEMIGALMDACELDYRLGVGKTFFDAEDAPESFVLAMAECDPSGDGGVRWYDERAQKLLTQFITDGDAEGASEQLNCLISSMEASAPRAIARRCMLMDTVNALVRTSDALGRPLGQSVVSVLYSCHEFLSFRRAAEPILAELCRAAKGASDDSRARRLNEVLKYIQEHALEYDMSKERVAMHFHMTESSLYRLLRDGINQSYVNYITEIRMERAKGMLTDERRTVAEVAQMVGYMNVSHFIKTFKQFTGYTPANYCEACREARKVGYEL